MKQKKPVPAIKNTALCNEGSVFMNQADDFIQARFMMTAAIMLQTTSMKMLKIRTGSQPMVKTSVSASAVQSPRPMKGS